MGTIHTCIKLSEHKEYNEQTLVLDEGLSKFVKRSMMAVWIRSESWALGLSKSRVLTLL